MPILRRTVPYFIAGVIGLLDQPALTANYEAIVQLVLELLEFWQQWSEDLRHLWLLSVLLLALMALTLTAAKFLRRSPFCPRLVAFRTVTWLACLLAAFAMVYCQLGSRGVMLSYLAVLVAGENYHRASIMVVFILANETRRFYAHFIEEPASLCLGRLCLFY